MAEWFTKDHAGIEGFRSATDKDWVWSQRSETLHRSGPSPAVYAKVKEFVRQFGPPPLDLEMYGEFDEEDNEGPPTPEDAIQAHRETP